jgi:hypothetical protein
VVPDGRDATTRTILDACKRNNLQTQFWTLIPEPLPGSTDQSAKVRAAAEKLRPLAEEAAKIGCKVALYNHGGWFGEPENQIAIIQELNLPNVGLVYNFHHGHHQIERFPEMFAAMKPHLLALNLNGMIARGDEAGHKILHLAEGDQELSMLEVVLESGWKGPVGILDHRDETDSRETLRLNLQGLDWLIAELQETGSGGPRPFKVPESTRRSSEAGASISPGSAKGLVSPGKPEYRQPPITVECWARLNSRDGFNILVASDTKASAAHWELYTYAGAGDFSLFMPGRGGEYRTGLNICDGQWHYLAMILEERRVRLFVNGEQVKDSPVPPISGQTIPGGLAFGRLVEGGIGLDGSLGAVRISRGVREIGGIPEGEFEKDERTLGIWDFSKEEESFPLRKQDQPRPKETSTSPRPSREPAPVAALTYVKKETRESTRIASIEATNEELGRIHANPWMGFSGAEPAFGPGGEAGLESEEGLRWSEIEVTENSWSEVRTVWLHRTIEADREQMVSFLIGSRAPVAIRLNGGPLHSKLGPPGWLADQISNMNEPVVLEGRLRRGLNHLSIKFEQPAQFYFGMLPLPENLLTELDARLAQDFPPAGEGRYYRIETITVPDEIVLEVGGLGFQPDGSLMICTRRGEVWNWKEGRWRLFAFGLQEPLGLLCEENGKIVVMQRSELTRIMDTTGDGRADLFETINADCGVSASQHAYIFGPVRDREGNFWGAISALGATPGSDYFGWSFKVTPEGEFIPWSSGLRSPNGLVMTPEGDLFIADNQGEYVATSPLHHISKGAFHGHPLGLRWDPTFSGDPYQASIEQLQSRAKPAAVLFPYGSMGQSLAEPVIDLTGGKFGPFAGQMFIADQTKANIMRVVLEKVNGEFQGACFPFRNGFQSGNNRLAFAPDGSLYAGQTDRGWGSIGGRGYGLERLVWTGRLPFEIHSMNLTPRGFKLVFTKPLDPDGAQNPAHYSLQNYYYAYQPRYGSPQTGHTPVSITKVELDADEKTVWIEVDELVTGRIYELNLGAIQAADGSELVHSSGYYTLNYLVNNERPFSSRH